MDAGVSVSQKTDEQLIDEIVERMHQRNASFCKAEDVTRDIREVFTGRTPPDDVNQRVMHKFCA